MLVQRGLPAVAFLGALGLIVGLAFAGSPQTLASGTRIAGVDVGGMTAAQARSTLARRSDALANQPVTFVAGTHTFRLRPRALGLEVDWAAAVETARRQGEGFGPFRGFKRLDVRFFGTDVAPATRVYEPALAYEVGRLAAVVDAAHREASIRLAGLTPVLVPGRTGQQLDRPAAAGVIARALASFERSPVGLPVHLDPPRVTTAQLRPVLADARTVLSAPVRLTLGKTRYRLPRWRLATLLQLPREANRALRIGGARADAYFGILARTVNREPVDATFAIAAGNRVSVVPDLAGRSLDAPATAQALFAAAVSRLDRRAKIVVTETPAARTAADARAMGITGLASGYETTFGGDFNRVHNVQLVSHLVDDKLIAPGAEFSFNGTTGERTAAKGFLEAPVIINGELQTGLGGGICQVSTTIFNAAYEAGLRITARTNHSLYISHYPLGRDATVNYPDTDLRFVNDTPHWLLLRTYVGSSSLVVNLYGTPQHRRVESVAAPLLETGPPPVKRTPDPTLDLGETVIDSYGSPSRSTSVERKVYSATGKLLYDNTWFSSYRAEAQQVRVGTKPPPEPVPLPKPKKQPEATPVVPQPAIPDFTLPR